MKKFWNYKLNNNNVPELLLYGTISETSWWGDETTPVKFKEELDNLGNVNEIVVRIYSAGGDVFAANAIYSMLKDHPAKIIVKIDGLAASAATIVAMAGDEILMSENAYFMIHLPSMSTYGNEDDIEKALDLLKSVKENIISTYENRTDLDREEIEEIMKEERWLTYNEALEKGFIDAILDDYEEELIENNTNFNKIQIYNDLTKLKNMPLKFKTWGNPTNKNKKIKKEEKVVMNIEELKNKFPEVYNEAYNMGVNAERERIKSLDEIANNIDNELIQNAKYEDIKDAQVVSLEAIKSNKIINNSYLEAMKKDAEIVNSVDGGNADTENKEQEIQNEIKNISEIAKKMINK